MANETRRSHWRKAVLAVLAALAVPAVMLLPASSAAAAEAQDTDVDTALHFFTRHDAAGVLARLEAGRPAPLTSSVRERVLALLPPEGEVSRLTVVQRQKLAALRRVLEVHGREATYVVKVVDVIGAFVGLHARSVVLVSEAALDLLDAGELQALVAHEIGHDYFWEEYFRARREDDRPGLRRLELLCDGFAIVTLRRAGTDPAHLTSALDKVVRYNRVRHGAAVNEDSYPAIGDRRTFAKRLAAWLTAAPISPSP